MTEKGTLYLSILVTAFFALFGIVWGVLTDSGMIIFDGICSGISLCLTFLSVLVLNQVDVQEDERFPFGRARFEPLLVLFKSITLIGACSYSATNSFSELLSGGRYVEPDKAIFYSLICTVGCFVVAVALHLQNNKLQSGIVGIERNEWFGDFLLSLGVLVGFTISYFLEDSSYAYLTPFADPMMVVVFSTLFIALLCRGIGEPLRQLLFYRADPVVVRPIEEEIHNIARRFNIQPTAHIVQTGRELNIEANFLVGTRAFSVEEMDEIRNILADTATKMGMKHWINVNFTKQQKWL